MSFLAIANDHLKKLIKTFHRHTQHQMENFLWGIVLVKLDRPDSNCCHIHICLHSTGLSKVISDLKRSHIIYIFIYNSTAETYSCWHILVASIVAFSKTFSNGRTQITEYFSQFGVFKTSKQYKLVSPFHAKKNYFVIHNYYCLQ